MHEHATRSSNAAPTRKPAAPRAAQADGLATAGNRALGDALTARPVQRWPDLDDLGGLLGGGPSMGNPTPDLGGLSLPSMPDLGSLGGGGGFNPMPDLGGLSLPSLPSLPSLGDLPGMPNIPGVNLNIDTDAGTASGGIDFHNGTKANASYGAGGLDASGQMGNAHASGHASATNDWSVQGGTTTAGGTKVGGSLSDSHGRFDGGLGILGAGGDMGSLTGSFGRGGLSGLASYAGQYGNLGLPF